MRIFCLWVAIFASSTSFAQSSQLKGVTAIEQVISDRLLNQQNFSFFRYFADLKADTYVSLVALMGSYRSNGGSSVFDNGQPNSVNVLLYAMFMNLLANEIQNNCVSSTGLKFNSDFASALQTLCQWPNPQAKDSGAMEKYWLSLMNYDAPESEFLAWRDFFLQSSYANQPATSVIGPMTYALFLNPNFLINR